MAPSALLLPVALVWSALAGLLFVGSGRFSLAAVEAGCASPAPDVRFAPAPRDLRSFASSCGAEGLAAYRDLQLVDLFYPGIAGLLLAGLAIVLGRQFRIRPALLALAPVLAAVGDYAENVAAWALIGSGAEVPDWVGSVFHVGSLVKNLASWVAWTTLLVLAGWAAGRWAANRWSPRRIPADLP